MGVTSMSDERPPEALDIVREHRDLFERLAQSDLPISEDAKRALARLNAGEDLDE